jgi:hypothetical protein
MRKRHRDKDRSCALCKPQKRGWSPRWSAREIALLRASESEIADSLREESPPGEQPQATVTRQRDA